MPVADLKTGTVSASAAPIPGAELAKIAALMKVLEENPERLALLESHKGPYTFSTTQIKVLMDVTTSIKTKMGMVEALGPRCIDPKCAKILTDEFAQSNEQKKQVEDILAARDKQLSRKALASSKATGGGGRGGGRGAAGRGRGAGRGATKSAFSAKPTEKFVPKPVVPKRRSTPAVEKLKNQLSQKQPSTLEEEDEENESDSQEEGGDRASSMASLSVSENTPSDKKQGEQEAAMFAANEEEKQIKEAKEKRVAEEKSKQEKIKAIEAKRNEDLEKARKEKEAATTCSREAAAEEIRAAKAAARAESSEAAALSDASPTRQRGQSNAQEEIRRERERLAREEEERRNVPPPPPIPEDLLFPYQELVVMTATKTYGHPGMEKSTLEIYCEDFDGVFGMKLEEFKGLPKWKQLAKRKAMKLF